MNNTLYLDLEGTVIDEFNHNPLYLINNIKIIKNIINKYDIKDFSIFSFALCEEKDFIFTYNEILPVLKKEFNIPSNLIFNIGNFLKKVYKFNKIYKNECETKFDTFPFNTKESIFELYIQIMGKPFTNSILIDDQVRNKKVILPGKSYELIKMSTT